MHFKKILTATALLTLSYSGVALAQTKSFLITPVNTVQYQRVNGMQGTLTYKFNIRNISEYTQYIREHNVSAVPAGSQGLTDLKLISSTCPLTKQATRLEKGQSCTMEYQSSIPSLNDSEQAINFANVLTIEGRLGIDQTYNFGVTVLPKGESGHLELQANGKPISSLTVPENSGVRYFTIKNTGKKTVTISTTTTGDFKQYVEKSCDQAVLKGNGGSCEFEYKTGSFDNPNNPSMVTVSAPTADNSPVILKVKLAANADASMTDSSGADVLGKTVTFPEGTQEILTITNNGSKELIFNGNGVSVDTGGNNDLKITNNCKVSQIAPGGNCTVDFDARNLSGAGATAIVTVESNSEDGSSLQTTFKFTANGHVTVENNGNKIDEQQLSLDLQEYAKGEITFENTGGKPVVLSDYLTVSGPFLQAITSDTCNVGTTLPCKVDYEVGTLSGNELPSTITVNSDAENSAITLNIALKKPKYVYMSSYSKYKDKNDIDAWAWVCPFDVDGNLGQCQNSGLTDSDISPASDGNRNLRRLALNPQGDKIYLINEGANKIIVCSVATFGGTFTNCRDSGAQTNSNYSSPNALVFNPSGTRAYVINTNDVSVYQVAADGSLTRIIAQDTNYPGAGNYSYGADIAFDAANTSIYITTSYPQNSNAIVGCNVTGSSDINNCSLANLYSDQGSTPVTLENPDAVAVDPNGKYLYVSDSAANGKVYVCNITPGTWDLTSCVDAGVSGIDSPTGLALNKGGDKMFILGDNPSNADKRQVWRCDVNGNDGKLSSCGLMNNADLPSTNMQGIVTTS